MSDQDWMSCGSDVDFFNRVENISTLSTEEMMATNLTFDDVDCQPPELDIDNLCQL